MLSEQIQKDTNLFQDNFLQRGVQIQLQSVLADLQMKLKQQIHLNQILRQTSQSSDPPIKEEAPEMDHHQVKYEEEEPEQNELELKNSQTTTGKKSKNKNQTKNVPKNFGKAIIKFSEKREDVVRKCLGEKEGQYRDFLIELKIKKKSINSIAELRGLWLQEEFEYASAMRKISLIFLNKYSLKHIFGSRITNYSAHIKYRARMIEVLRSPQDFTYIKNC